MSSAFSSVSARHFPYFVLSNSLAPNKKVLTHIPYAAMPTEVNRRTNYLPEE
jgi:hypothetical protein